MGPPLLRRAGVATALLLTAACGTVPVAAPRTDPSPAAPGRPQASAPAAAPTSASVVQVVGLGDSVTSGEHCACDDYVTGFGHLLARRDHVRVVATDDGESGSTSDGLADGLTGRDADDRRLQADVARSDVVVVTMGANDLAPALAAWRAGGCTASCYDPEVAGMGTDLGRVLDRVGTLGHDHARVLVTTYWNVFTDGQVARAAERPGYLAWSDTVTRRANTAIAGQAAARGATVVDLYAPFKGAGAADPTPLLAPDGDHPDAAGTAVISRAVLAAYGPGR